MGHCPWRGVLRGPLARWWHEGAPLADADSGLVHTVVGTAANVSDVTQAHALFQGRESEVFGDACYQGVDEREDNQGRQVSWHIALRPGKRRALPDTPWGVAMARLEQVKARIRAKFEHALHVVKNVLRHRKTRYRGLEKTPEQLQPCLAWPTWCWRASGSLRPRGKVHPESKHRREKAVKRY